MKTIRIVPYSKGKTAKKRKKESRTKMNDHL